MYGRREANLDTINIYLISDIIDLISSDSLKDKRFKFSDQQILTIMVLKEIKGLSLRGIVKELHSSEAYRKFCKISDEVPSIETLSYLKLCTLVLRTHRHASPFLPGSIHSPTGKEVESRLDYLTLHLLDLYCTHFMPSFIREKMYYWLKHKLIKHVVYFSM